MLADNARRLVLAIAAISAITACSGSTLKTTGRKDSGTASPDLGPKSDLPADSNPVYQDAAPDVGVVTVDTGPDVPLLGRDSASPDATIIEKDAGPDSSIVPQDAARDAVAEKDAAVDSGGSLACTGTLLFGTLPLVESGQGQNSVASGDLNDDGKLDLVTANRGPGTVSVLLGSCQ